MSKYEFVRKEGNYAVYEDGDRVPVGDFISISDPSEVGAIKIPFIRIEKNRVYRHITHEERMALSLVFEYDADCPICLRDLPHSIEQHESALTRNFEASIGDPE